MDRLRGRPAACAALAAAAITSAFSATSSAASAAAILRSSAWAWCRRVAAFRPSRAGHLIVERCERHIFLGAGTRTSTPTRRRYRCSAPTVACATTRPRRARARDAGAGSLNHLVGAQQQRLRHRDAERLGGLQVDDQLERVGCSSADRGCAPSRMRAAKLASCWSIGARRVRRPSSRRPRRFRPLVVTGNLARPRVR